MMFYFQFNPELVVVSAGFDAAIGCPEVRHNDVKCCVVLCSHLGPSAEIHDGVVLCCVGKVRVALH